MKFVPSSTSSIGMELELQLLDAESLDLRPGIVPLMDLFPDTKEIKPEFFQSCVEIASPVCRNTTELYGALMPLLRGLRANCSRLGMRLASAGTHPFCRRLALITPSDRYRQMEKEIGYVGHLELIFGIHVHVGMADDEQAIRVMRQLRPCLAVLLAVSANSPFWRGGDTLFASYRHRVIGASRSYGMPPEFQDWAAFQAHFEASVRAGMIGSIKDVHWDIRPHPDFGTLEIRIMDAQVTVSECVALAALVHALTRYFGQTPEGDIDPRVPRPLQWLMDEDNCYRASRYGMDMAFIVDESGQTRPVREVLENLLEILGPVSAELGESADLARAGKLLDAPGSAQQRAVLMETGSAEMVVRSLANSLDEEISAFTGS